MFSMGHSYMQNFKAESAILDGSIATFQATGDRYRVTLLVERKAGGA
jgi:hypothetical protein